MGGCGLSRRGFIIIINLQSEEILHQPVLVLLKSYHIELYGKVTYNGGNLKVNLRSPTNSILTIFTSCTTSVAAILTAASAAHAQ